MGVVWLTPPPQRVRHVHRPTVRDQLDGLALDLAEASRESRDPLAAEELVSAVRRLHRIIRRVDAGDLA